MSSIRLFILSSFDELGPMHGHRLRLEAERKHMPLWTDISVGAVYGAAKRLADEGLLREAGQEREGNRPTRQLYAITDEGRQALAELRRAGLTEVWFKYDPFDLALTRSDPAELDELPTLLSERLKRTEQILEERRRIAENARAYIGVAEEWALRHSVYRLEAEVRFLAELVATAPEIVADQRQPRPRKQKTLDEARRMLDGAKRR
jgi:DNA-binding PadR family transcriptional regulator